MIRWGIIGTGAIANEFASDFTGVKSGELKYCYGRNEEKALMFSKKYRISYDTEIDKFLEREDMDAVYIALPHSLHKEFSIKAIKSGKAVLCEKPFSYNYETTKEILDLAIENNVFIMEALWTMYLPAMQKVLKWIDSGAIGRVRHVEANFGFKGADIPDGRLLNPELAGGSLLDVGIYPLLLVQAISNSEPIKISAEAQMTYTGVDGHLAMLLRYEDGMTASLSSSIDLDTSQKAVIYGEKGKIVMPYFFRGKEVSMYVDGEEIHHKEEYLESGYNFETEAVSVLLKSNEKESKVIPHDFTMRLSKTMDNIKSIIGLNYPFE